MWHILKFGAKTSEEKGIHQFHLTYTIKRYLHANQIIYFSIASVDLWSAFDHVNIIIEPSNEPYSQSMIRRGVIEANNIKKFDHNLIPYLCKCPMESILFTLLFNLW